MQEPARRRVAVLGDMLELGADEREHHREIGAYAAAARVDLLVTVGPLAARDGARVRRRGPRGRRRRGGRADRARPRASPATSCSSRAHAEWASRSWPRRWRGGALMGEILIGGTASLLICVFLSPKFIAFLREREFGQHIREDGPQEHHAKAGTPTMGGIIIFTAIAVPFLLLTDRDARRSGSSGSRVACARWASPTTTRSSSSALARPARPDKLLVTVADRDRAVARRRPSGATCRTRSTCASSTPRSTSATSIRSSSPRARRDDVGGEPHRRARRPGRGMHGDRPARLHRDHVHHAARPTRARRRVPRSGRASGSSGSTRSPPRSSWATPARSAWAA